MFVLLFLLPALPHLLALRNPGPPTRPADAIFVLTGGEGRIQEGFRAWSGGAARELYILGAGRTVPIERIVPEASRLPAEALARVHVEGWSVNTLENAFSAKTAVGEGKYSSVILVTSDYHIPRAHLAFRKVLPPGRVALRDPGRSGGEARGPPGGGRGGTSSRVGNIGDTGSSSGGSEAGYPETALDMGSTLRCNICYYGDRRAIRMFKIKVRKIGNSLGAILPGEVAARLRVKEGDNLSMTETADGIQLSPYDPDFRRHTCRGGTCAAFGAGSQAIP